MIKRDLLLERVAALLGRIEEEHDAAVQVSQCSDRLHFDSVSLLEAVVQDSGSVDDLPSHVLVIEVTNEQRFRRERVRLNFDVGLRDFVDE